MNNYNPTNLFLAPEKPFLIQYDIIEGTDTKCGWAWFETEDDLMEFIKNTRRERENKFIINDLCEIGYIREIVET